MAEIDLVRSPGRAASIATTMLVRLGEVVNRTLVLPVVIFFPTSRCNSRCVSCDWWKSSGADDLTVPEIAILAQSLPSLGTRVVAFTGGEPLLRPDVFEAARLFKNEGLRLHLLTSGVLLERCAEDVTKYFDRVIVSLDAATEGLYQAIRGVPALVAVEKGVAALRRRAPTLPITARSTIHRMNFREVVALIDHAKAMAVDGISFLPADVTSSAFNRTHGLQPSTLTLNAGEIAEFTRVIEQAIASRPEAFSSGFVAESPDRLRRLPRYYAAMDGQGAFPGVSCNAPWMSVVVEADGDVRPCFFHEAIGNVRRARFESIVSDALPAFRKSLDVSDNAICKRCVCSIKTGWRGAPWQ